MKSETFGRAPKVRNRHAWLAIALLLVFLALFWSLPSHDYLAVDGAVRCLGVYFDRNFLFHGNNHLLYPFWVGRWSGLVQSFGIKASNAFEFVRISQAMNGVFGAAAIAVLYTILQLLVDYPIALLCSLIFGFSTALVLHATNSAEPLPGLFFTLLGVRVLMEGLRRNSRLILTLAGIFFALALASYQAMATIAGVGVFACVWWSSSRREDKSILSAPHSLFWVGLGGLFAVCGIYGFAYYHKGIPIAQMPHEFVSLGGAQIYSGVTPSRLLNLPLGLIRNLFGDGPQRYNGIRSLLHDPQRTLWIPSVLAGLITVGLIAFLASEALWKVARKSSGGPILAGLGAIVLLCIPLAYWDPLYDKLWLLPIAAATTVVAISFRPGLLLPRERRILTTLLIVVLATEVAVNLPRVVRSHLMATPYLTDAEDLSRFITPRDWVVLDFDDVSVLWGSFWGEDAKYLLLPSSTAASAQKWLASAKQACQQTDARILFVGVLDEDRKTWDGFLGQRAGIPFGSLDEYRAQATIVKRYVFENRTITVRHYR